MTVLLQMAAQATHAEHGAAALRADGTAVAAGGVSASTIMKDNVNAWKAWMMAGDETEQSRTPMRSALVQAGKSGLAGTSSSVTAASLRAELAVAARGKKQLRERLAEIGREAHMGLTRLLTRVQKAEAAATRVQSELRSELAKSSQQLSAEQSEEQHLREELAAAGTATDSSNSESALRLQAQLEAAEKDRDHLRAQLAAAMQDAEQQRAQITSGAQAEKGQLRAHAAAAMKAAADEERRLEAEQAAYAALEANMTAQTSSAAAAGRAARREKMGLLEQISELQEEVQQSHKRVSLAEGRYHDAMRDASQQADEQQRALWKADQEQRKLAAELREEVHVAEMNATDALASAAAAQKETSSLRQEISKRDVQLHTAALEANDLREQREATARSEASLQRRDARAEAALKDEQAKLQDLRTSADGADVKVVAAKNETLSAVHDRDQARGQFAALQKASAEREAKTQKTLHETMLAAAYKVRAAEDERENLEEELNKTKKQLQEADAESAKSKDTLVQETDAALKAQQRADALSTNLSDAESAAEERGAKVKKLSQEIEELRSNRDRAFSAFQKSSGEASNWKSKSEQLQQTLKEDEAKLQSALTNNNNLREQVTELSGDGQRADELSSQVDNLQKSDKKLSDKKAQLEDQVQRLRDLKDRYSADYDASRNESDTWRAKAQDLMNQLQGAQKQNEALARQGQSAAEHVRMARQQEDEYFEENTQLTQQTEQLKDRVAEAEEQINTTANENRKLRDETDSLKADQEREQRNSHAAWVENERELVQSRRDQETAKMLGDSEHAELARTRALLTDAQRKTLGLPAAAPPTPTKAGATATLHVVAKATPTQYKLPAAVAAEAAATAVAATASTASTATSALGTGSTQPEPATVSVSLRLPRSTVSSQDKSGAVAPPLTPQLSHVKVWGKAPTAHLRAGPAQQPTAASSATKSSVLLPGEPNRPNTDPAVTLASAEEAVSSPQSALQRLADYFAAPPQ